MKDFLENNVNTGDNIYCWPNGTGAPVRSVLGEIIEVFTGHTNKWTSMTQAYVDDYGQLFSNDFIVVPNIIESEIISGDTIVFKMNDDNLSKATVESISDDFKNAIVKVGEFVKYTVDKDYMIKVKNGKQSMINYMQSKV
jgi:hypothetical protein